MFWQRMRRILSRLSSRGMALPIVGAILLASALQFRGVNGRAAEGQQQKGAEKQGGKKDGHEGHVPKAEDKSGSHQNHGQAGTQPASASAAFVAEGYHVQVVLQNLNYPTSVAFDEKGVPYISEAGYVPGDLAMLPRIIRVPIAGEIETVVSEGLDGPPTDLLWYRGRLYFSHGGKISTWSDKEKLVDLAEGLSRPPHPGRQATSLVGPDGNIFFWRGDRLMRIDPKANVVEPFFGRLDDDFGKGGGEPRHNHGPAATEKGHQEHAKPPMPKKEQGHEGHKQTKKEDFAKKAMEQHHMNHAGKGLSGPKNARSSAGPRRLMDVRFAPDGKAIYVVDFGASVMTPDGPRPVPWTGVLWRIISSDAPVDVLLP